MKQLCIIIFLSVSTLLQAVSMIPHAREYEMLDGAWFTLSGVTRIETEEPSLEVMSIWLSSQLNDFVQVDLRKVKRAKQHISLLLDDEMAATPQSYFLSVSDREIVVTGHDPEGVFYGIQTLLQWRDSTLMFDLGKTVCRWPVLIVDDAPSRLVRGVVFDSLKQGASLQSVYTFIKRASELKLNAVFIDLPREALLGPDTEHLHVDSAHSASVGDNLSETLRFDEQQWRALQKYAENYYMKLVPIVEKGTVDQSLLVSEGAPIKRFLEMKSHGVEMLTPHGVYICLSDEAWVSEALRRGEVMWVGTETAIPIDLSQQVPFFKERIFSLEQVSELLWILPDLFDFSLFSDYRP